MKPIQLNIGSGILFLKDFINVDKYIDFEKAKTKKGEYINAVVPKGVKFVQGDVLDLPFKDNYADYIETIDMIEHLPMRDVIPAIYEMWRVLKPGGDLVIVTTDFDEVARQWLIVKEQKEFNLTLYLGVAEVIYGNQIHEGEFHKTPFSPQFLFRCLMGGGFLRENISMVGVPTGGKMPDLRGHKNYTENTVVRSTMLIATAKKGGLTKAQ